MREIKKKKIYNSDNYSVIEKLVDKLLTFKF